MATASSVRYEIIERLASSETVDVYEAVHPEKPGRLVLEVFHAARSASWAFAGCLREMEIIAGLGHPNLWQAVESSALPDGTPMLVTERGPGCNLGDWLEGSVRIGAEEVATLIREVAGALDAAHQAGVAHGLLSAEMVYLPDGLDAAPLTPQLQGFGRRWLQPLLEEPTPNEPTSLPWESQRARDLSSFALLVERLLVPSALATEAIERRFALGPEVSVVIDRAIRPRGEPFATASALATALVKAIGQDGIALRHSETMAVGGFFATPDEIGAGELEPVPPSAFRRRWPLLASGAAAGFVALLLGLPSIQDLSRAPGTQKTVEQAASSPAAAGIAKPESLVAIPRDEDRLAAPAPAEIPLGESAVLENRLAQPALRGNAVLEPEPAENVVAPSVPRPNPRAKRLRAKPTYVWSPSLGRLVAVDERGLPLPDAPTP